MTGRVRHLSLAALVLLTVPAACSNGGDGADNGNAASERGTGRPFRVSTLTENFVDTSRSAEGLADRPLVTTISYPSSVDGPFPLIVLAHGLMDHPRDFSGLATAWAEAGYVVAVPAFPLSNADAPGGPTPADFANQPGDVSFVIDEVARLSEQEGHALEARVDADQFIPPTTGPEIYEMAVPPKLLVTITNGTHWPPYRNDPDAADDTVTATTTDFWDVYLAGSTESLDNSSTTPPSTGRSVLEHETE